MERGLCGEATSAMGLDGQPGRPRGWTCGVFMAPTPFAHGNQDHWESSCPRLLGAHSPPWLLFAVATVAVDMPCSPAPRPDPLPVCFHP